MDEQFLNTLRQFNINPSNLAFYETAFTHRSFLNESKQDNLQSNERLEYLGDAVLQLIISTYLYRERTEDPEGDLTNLRAFIVKTPSLAKISKKLNLGQFLKMSKGEDLTGGRENNSLLANTYEAILGAIYLDLGMDKATEFIHQTLLPEFESEIKQGAPRDFKSQLQEAVQAKFQVSPRYRIISASGPDHSKTFVVGVFVKEELLGEGTGANKQSAEERAAQFALRSLL